MSNRSKNMLLSVASFIVVFAVAEIAARLVFSSNTILNINIGASTEYHPTRRKQLKKNYKAPNISINSHGILGPEFTIEPASDVVRILTIGNSVTYSPAKRNYSRVLEDRLRRFFPGRSIEVIVGAVPGYSTYEALDWYDEFLNRLMPDITVIYLGWNDLGQFSPFGLRYKNQDLYQKRTVLGWLTEHFYVFRVLFFVQGRIEQSRPIDLSEMTPEEASIAEEFEPTHYEENLEALIKKLRRDGSNVYLMTLAGLITNDPTDEEFDRVHFPRNFGKKLKLYQAIYAKYCERLEMVAQTTQTPLIDLGPLLQTPEQRLIFRDTMHLTDKGAEVYGEFLAERLRPAVAAVLAEKPAPR